LKLNFVIGNFLRWIEMKTVMAIAPSQKSVGHGQDARDTRLEFVLLEIAPADQSLGSDQRKAQDGG
jgi:hypothetical protein